MVSAVIAMPVAMGVARPGQQAERGAMQENLGNLATEVSR